jgi:hypothetical protein
MDFTNSLLIDSAILLIILTLVFQTNRLKKLSKKQSEIQKQQAKIQEREKESYGSLDVYKTKVKNLIKYQRLIHGLNHYHLSCVELDESDNNNKQCKYLIRHTNIDKSLTYAIATITLTNGFFDNVEFITSNNSDVDFEMQKWIYDNAQNIVETTSDLYF